MIQATLYTYKTTSLVTRSLLVVEGETFHILERPWLNNASNISCIPGGKYLCKYVERSASGRYRNVYHVQGVPSRTGILIHAGNVPAHSKGCLIIGSKIGTLSGVPAVLGSRTALAKLNSLLQGQDFELEIIRCWNS